MDLAKIKSILRQQKPFLRKEFKIKEIGIFGSTVRGESKANSDLDVLVEFKEVPSLLRFITMEQYLKRILRVKVDLVMRSALKPFIGRWIKREVEYI